MIRPICPFCKKDINSSTVRCETIDVSLTNPNGRFIEIFYCGSCGAVLNIHKPIKAELEK